MALTFGITLPYTDNNTGLTLPNAFVVITHVAYGKPSQALNLSATSATVQYRIYINQTKLSANPVFNEQLYHCEYGDGSNNFETYFLPSVMAQASHDIMTQGYAFLTAYLPTV